ncbi:HET-domain-containing protein [Cucurbitaria berberidis CBS 394.84]|uniref:HET-domain-containing protein n=1 Tax=Cucurbitaria berberidis CBS 394.84 TaxID=1168544 RepID=A0A9P4GK14_9PLEO|nr:HET-domain-containing protein [Cucurbitaria berberidis CBS 394.84]KAF1847723.1 HET-domain-containing protein [Cucurbitaria berberidis CBS 394.84]
MRLLRINDDGQLSLVEYGGTDIPHYAILSHRWGPESEEVTFRDVIENTGNSKAGYYKIRSCAKQAAKDGLHYFWVDTCCIDKSSSSELSEAINSMWRWYRDAQVCYAYLRDVPAGTDAFAASEWFTRGWTLQELLAPAKVVLYNASWKPIGTKKELAFEISIVTRIDKYYLSSDASALERASIAEKMSWASARVTKRPEDVAYSLLGIFDINMPLLYGEGTRAFQRLQEEIMKQSDDQSIFASRPSVSPEVDALLAQSPADFSTCGNIVRSINSAHSKPYAMTNRGLQIELPLLTHENKIFAGLNCRFADDFFSDLAIPLRKISGNQYHRAEGIIREFTTDEWRRARVQSMYISTKPHQIDSRGDIRDNSSVVQRLPFGYVVSRIFPPQSGWSPGICTFEGNPQDLSNRRLMLVSSLIAHHHFLFMMCLHKNRVFHDGVWEARLLPVPVDENCDLIQIFSHWKGKDLSTLPRTQKSEFGVVVLRATPRCIRGRKLTTVDIAISTDQGYGALEISEQAIAFFRSTGDCFAHVLAWGCDLVVQLLIARFSVVLYLLNFGFIFLIVRNTHFLNPDFDTFHVMALTLLGMLSAPFIQKLQMRMAIKERIKQPRSRGGVGWQDRLDHVSVGYLSILLVSIVSVTTLFQSLFELDFYLVNLYISGACMIMYFMIFIPIIMGSPLDF